MTSQAIILGFLGVVIVSLVSLVGAFLLFKEDSFFEKVKNGLIALAIGALIGDALLHLLPQSIKEVGSAGTFGAGLLGFGLFVVFERFLHWKHHHLPNEKRGVLPVGKINLISDAIHNFIDGVVIGASFLISIPIGITTTLAVVLHEIPQELGDFAVLVKAGFPKKRALLFNFLSAAVSILGFIAVVISSGKIQIATPWALGFTAGGFFFIAYIMARDLLKDHSPRSGYLKFIWLIVGFLSMYLLTFVE